MHDQGARVTFSRSNDRPIFRARGRVGARVEKRGGEASSAAAILDRARQLPRSHRQTPRPPLSPDPVRQNNPGPTSPTPLPLRAAIAIAPGPGAREKGGGRSSPPPIAIRSSAAAPAPVVRASGSTEPDSFPSYLGAVDRLPRRPHLCDTASCRDMAAPAPPGRPQAPARRPRRLPSRPCAGSSSRRSRSLLHALRHRPGVGSRPRPRVASSSGPARCRPLRFGIGSSPCGCRRPRAQVSDLSQQSLLRGAASGQGCCFNMGEGLRVPQDRDLCARCGPPPRSMFFQRWVLHLFGGDEVDMIPWSENATRSVGASARVSTTSYIVLLS